MRLDRLSARIVPRDQPARWTVAGLEHEILLASAWSVSLTRVPTCPLGSQKRAKAQRLSASVSDMVGPAMTLACSLLFRFPARHG